MLWLWTLNLWSLKTRHSSESWYAWLVSSSSTVTHKRQTCGNLRGFTKGLWQWLSLGLSPCCVVQLKMKTAFFASIVSNRRYPAPYQLALHLHSRHPSDLDGLTGPQTWWPTSWWQRPDSILNWKTMTLTVTWFRFNACDFWLGLFSVSNSLTVTVVWSVIKLQKNWGWISSNVGLVL